MSNNEGWFEVEGEIVGTLIQLDDESQTVVVNVKRWRDVSWAESTWCMVEYGAVPHFMVRHLMFDHVITVRGTAYQEELGAGLGDTIRFTTNREEVENTVQWC